MIALDMSLCYHIVGSERCEVSVNNGYLVTTEKDFCFERVLVICLRRSVVIGEKNIPVFDSDLAVAYVSG